MINRDLDAAIEQDIFGWRLTHVGPDYDGQNECEVLTSNGQLPKDYLLPPKGKLHRGFFCRRFSEDWDNALFLARYVRLSIPVHDIPLNPEELTQMCAEHWKRELDSGRGERT